jgi:hypothetical protein
MGVVLSERTASGKALNAVRQLGLGKRLVNVGAARVAEKVLFCLNSGRKWASDGQKLGFWQWFGAGLALVWRFAAGVVGRWRSMVGR